MRWTEDQTAGVLNLGFKASFKIVSSWKQFRYSKADR